MANVVFKKPRFVVPEATKDKTIVDLVMMVAGTTDPINTKGLKHEANTTYWDGKDKDGNASLVNFWAKVKELKPQFHNLHIEGKFFSWSGDNDTQERNLAADRLLDLIKREYPGFKRKEVHLHLIGHSHGGNVINQFTNLITTEKGKAFPELWKIKSITYLSTPFFQNKHQLNHAKLHPACKIINVHNGYDLTQQFVADFSLINLEVLIRNLNKGNFDKALKKIKAVDFTTFDVLSDLYIKDDTEGPSLWRSMAILLDGIKLLISAVIDYILSIKTERFKVEKKQFLDLLNRILNWATTAQTVFSTNQSRRRGGYGRSEFFTDLNLLVGLRLFNEILAIKTGESDSYLLGILETLFKENTGITDSIEQTGWNPKKQTKGLEIIDVPITDSDKYNSRKKKANFDAFLTPLQSALQAKKLREVLMRLLSQFITGNQVKDIQDKIGKLEYVVSGESDTQLKLLRKTHLQIYRNLVTRYHADLVAPQDLNTGLMERPGGIPYLATISHSLSHSQFWDKAKNGLKSAFGSGINPGYKGK